MRSFVASLEFTPEIPDTMANVVLAAGTAQAFNYPTGMNVVRLAGATTAGGVWSFAFNGLSTAAVWPAATVNPTTSSTGLNTIVPHGEYLIYQIPSGSTGFSLISGTSGIVTVEFWKRA